jgi:hypothetical protein
MDTREVHARLAVEALERIAANAASRIVPKVKAPTANLFEQLQMYRGPIQNALTSILNKKQFGMTLLPK